MGLIRRTDWVVVVAELVDTNLPPAFTKRMLVLGANIDVNPELPDPDEGTVNKNGCPDAFW